MLLPPGNRRLRKGTEFALSIAVARGREKILAEVKAKRPAMRARPVVVAAGTVKTTCSLPRLSHQSAQMIISRASYALTAQRSQIAHYISQHQNG